MNYSIKIAETEDEVNEFLDLISDVFPDSEIEIDDDDIIFLAYLENDPVGFVHINENDESYAVKSFGVINDARRKGIGTLLLKESTDQLTGKPVYLKTNSLHPAINLYHNCGFFMEEFGGETLLVKREIN